MKLRLIIYNLLVNRKPEIRKNYHRMRNEKKGRTWQIYAWLYLLGLNIKSIFGISGKKHSASLVDEEKYAPKECSESSFSGKEEPRILAEKLKKYDVISFDAFDTLIFRPFEQPKDLFHLIGLRLGYLDYPSIRVEMEYKARERKRKQGKGSEVTLEEIYDLIQEETGIPKERGMSEEIKAELESCYGNPYFLEVFSYLKQAGKIILVTSDMYLPETVIQKIIEGCGYQGIEKYYISCEQQESKNEGTLYERIKEEWKHKETFIQVGDHPISDIEQAKKHHWEAIYYPNVNQQGKDHRTEDLSMITGSLYRGIVNSHLYCGLKIYSREYELGFVYGGLFVYGYCQFIHDYVKRNQLDKILFLSRDGDILHRVYKSLFPEEEKQIEYVLWSRAAAVKMTARYFKYDYFRRFLYHKINQEYTLEQIFTSMELEDMLPELLIVAGNDRRYTKQTILTNKNIEVIKRFLMENWETVLEHYESQIVEGGKYYESILRDCKKVCAVDVGWAGSGAIALNYLVNEVWDLSCEMIGLLAGTNSRNNAEPDASEAFLHKGRLESYLYAQDFNRDLWKYHDPAKGHNLYLEILLSSTQNRFLAFSKDGFVFDVGNELPKKEVEEMQRGIFEFVELFQRHGLGTKVSGRDAYAPLLIKDVPVGRFMQAFAKEINL